MTRAVFLALVLAACKDDPRITVDGSMDGAAGCQKICEGELQCRNGIAYHRPPAQVPCDQWQGTCAGTVVVCSAGCDLDFGLPRTDDWSMQLRALCADAAQAQPGDSCAAGCVPTRAVADGQGGVQQQYLRCDAGSNQCVVTTAPDVPSYLMPCVAGLDYAEPGVNGIVRESGMACLLAWDTSTASARHGLSNFCVGDWECAAGASCDDSLPFLNVSGANAAVCRPGPRGAPLVGHLP
jgi:hypothetical protein